MYLASSEGTLLQMAIVDISKDHSHRTTAASRPRARVSRTPSIASRAVTNVVRLVPGRTRLQFGLGTR